MNEQDYEKLIFGISHQIRNPCGIILANANLLLKKPGLPSEEIHSLEAIANGVRYLESRLDEFVEFSKPLILNLKQIPIKKLFQDVTTLTIDQCRLNKIKITCNADPNLYLSKADPQQLILAFLNILLNSIESINSKDGFILIEAKKTAVEHLLITIKDNGCGIHPKDLPEVFSPFYSTKVAGIGIGLAVAKKIIGAHQGKIEIQSEQGKGTTVTIQLPY